MLWLENGAYLPPWALLGSVPPTIKTCCGSRTEHFSPTGAPRDPQGPPLYLTGPSGNHAVAREWCIYGPTGALRDLKRPPREPKGAPRVQKHLTFSSIRTHSPNSRRKFEENFENAFTRDGSEPHCYNRNIETTSCVR